MPSNNPAGSRLEQRLRHETRGEVLFDAFSRGRYSTDASIYQIEPVGVVVPRDKEDVAAEPRNAGRPWANPWCWTARAT